MKKNIYFDCIHCVLWLYCQHIIMNQVYQIQLTLLRSTWIEKAERE